MCDFANWFDDDVYGISFVFVSYILRFSCFWYSDILFFGDFDIFGFDFFYLFLYGDISFDGVIFDDNDWSGIWCDYVSYDWMIDYIIDDFFCDLNYFYVYTFCSFFGSVYFCHYQREKRMAYNWS